jgi:hypothetical protein
MESGCKAPVTVFQASRQLRGTAAATIALTRLARRLSGDLGSEKVSDLRVVIDAERSTEYGTDPERAR